MNENSSMTDSVAQQARLLAALSSLCTQENTDVVIECQEEKIKCHRVVLTARSMFFYQLLESGNDVVSIDYAKGEIMRDVVKYIYTDQIEITADNLIDLMTASVRFQLPSMLEKCFKMFRNQINFDTAVDVLILADKLHLEEFKSVAINRITKNRQMLIADTEFRKKMVDNPDLLLTLYENLCQQETGLDDMSSSVVSSQSSVSSSNGCLWTCVCGSTVPGQFCPWCGYHQ